VWPGVDPISVWVVGSMSIFHNDSNEVQSRTCAQNRSPRRCCQRQQRNLERGITPPTKHPVSNSLSAHPEGESVQTTKTRISACPQGDLRFPTLPKPAPEKGPARSLATPFRPDSGRFSLRFSVKKDLVLFRPSKAVEQFPLLD